MRRVVVTLLALCLALGAHSAAASPRLGSAIWTRTLSRGAWGFAIDRTGGVVITDAGGVLAFEPSGGATWRTNVDGIAKTTPAIGADVVVIATKTGATAFSRVDGAQRWQQSTGSPVSSVALANGFALIGDQSGALAVVDTATGALRWSVAYAGNVFGARRSLGTHRSGGLARARRLSRTRIRPRHRNVPVGVSHWSRDGDADRARYDRVRRAGRRQLSRGGPGVGPRHRCDAMGHRGARFVRGLDRTGDRGGELVVVDHAGVVTMLDTATGHVRWQRDVEQFVLETRVSLTSRRVTFVDFSGDVFVLDRRSGRIVSGASAADLGGFVVTAETTPWPRHRGILLATRLASERLQLRRLP